MSIHRIQLRGPWRYEWLGTAPVTSSQGTVKFPATWNEVFGSVAGSALFRRTFHRPTNLEPSDRVFLVIPGLRGTLRVRLNDVPLEASPAPAGQEFELTRDLLPVNQLAVEIDFDPGTTADPGGLYAPVAIEIRTGS